MQLAWTSTITGYKYIAIASTQLLVATAQLEPCISLVFGTHIIQLPTYQTREGIGTDHPVLASNSDELASCQYKHHRVVPRAVKT
ncbi:hypothetical protein VTK73DRAFT_612 [Phialemonium thermophilum]|uniref:Uncharacterized protein n=1 Tax=Phialemonium thermophilum TaxID=223376 RepID=A0ABR3XDL0_9PEZI